MAERRKLITGLALGVLGTTLIVAVDGNLNDDTTVSRVEQPESNLYPDDGTYSAILRKVNTPLLRRHRPYELWINRSGDPHYGHRVQIDGLDPAGDKPRITAADWRREGVRVSFTGGHEVFVPARWYLGGR
ncbi:hypothetical protein ACIBF1_35055 [Spirillospora sp. NPDC050679]